MPEFADPESVDAIAYRLRIPREAMQMTQPVVLNIQQQFGTEDRLLQARSMAKESVPAMLLRDWRPRSPQAAKVTSRVAQMKWKSLAWRSASATLLSVTISPEL